MMIRDWWGREIQPTGAPWHERQMRVGKYLLEQFAPFIQLIGGRKGQTEPWPWQVALDFFGINIRHARAGMGRDPELFEDTVQAQLRTIWERRKLDEEINKLLFQYRTAGNVAKAVRLMVESGRYTETAAIVRRVDNLFMPYRANWDRLGPQGRMDLEGTQDERGQWVKGKWTEEQIARNYNNMADEYEEQRTKIPKHVSEEVERTIKQLQREGKL